MSHIKKALALEETMAQLSQLVEAMEKGDLSFDESLEHYTKGCQLAKDCMEMLKNAEQKVEILMRQNEHWNLEPFNADKNNDSAE